MAHMHVLMHTEPRSDTCYFSSIGKNLSKGQRGLEMSLLPNGFAVTTHTRKGAQILALLPSSISESPPVLRLCFVPGGGFWEERSCPVGSKAPEKVRWCRGDCSCKAWCGKGFQVRPRSPFPGVSQIHHSISKMGNTMHTSPSPGVNGFKYASSHGRGSEEPPDLKVAL